MAKERGDERPVYAPDGERFGLPSLNVSELFRIHAIATQWHIFRHTYCQPLMAAFVYKSLQIITENVA